MTLEEQLEFWHQNDEYEKAGKNSRYGTQS